MLRRGAGHAEEGGGGVAAERGATAGLGGAAAEVDGGHGGGGATSKAERRERPGEHPDHKARIYPRFVRRHLSGAHQGARSGRREFHVPFLFQLVYHKTGLPSVIDQLVV